MIGIFMPGRLGSERLPNKLILPFGESCLWDIACKKLNELPKHYEKAVLVCEKELIDIAKKYPNIKIIKRDEQTAKADNPLNFVFKDIDNMESEYVMFLNPCLSMLQTAKIRDVLEFYEVNDKIYLESVKRFRNWLWKSGGELVFDIDFKSLNTKYLPKIYEDAHAFRIFPKKEFLETGYMLKPYPLIYEISDSEAIDVDTELDYKVALECYNKQNGKT
jgi:CMP-N-acetylneuraminic acid synthetase